METFVYGTLTDSGTAARMLDEFTYRDRATLHGLRRVDGRYPTLAPGGSTVGRILSTPQRDTLDRYEGVDRGLYVRCQLPAQGLDVDTVHCYVGDPNVLDAPAQWPGDESFGERVRRYCRDNAVHVTQSS